MLISFFKYSNFLLLNSVLLLDLDREEILVAPYFFPSSLSEDSGKSTVLEKIVLFLLNGSSTSLRHPKTTPITTTTRVTCERLNISLLTHPASIFQLGLVHYHYDAATSHHKYLGFDSSSMSSFIFFALLFCTLALDVAFWFISCFPSLGIL